MSYPVARRGQGRPTILTPELEDVIAAALLATPIKTRAAEHAGISMRSWATWELKGEEDIAAIATERDCEPEDLDLTNITFEDSCYAHFLLRVRKARADYLIHKLGHISEAGTGDRVTITKTVKRKGKDGEEIIEVTTTERVDKHWTALAWLIERQYEEFRLNQRMELTGRDGGPVEISPVSPAERLRAKLDNLTDREDGREDLLAELDAASTPGIPEGESGLDILERPSSE